MALVPAAATVAAVAAAGRRPTGRLAEEEQTAPMLSRAAQDATGGDGAYSTA